MIFIGLTTLTIIHSSIMEELNNEFISPECAFDETAMDLLGKYYCV